MEIAANSFLQQLRGCRTVVLGVIFLSAHCSMAAAETIGGSLGPAPASKPASPISSLETAPLRLKLPFPVGTRYQVFQGNAGSFTHTGFNQYAWDFGLPEGAEVCAAAQGRVVRIKQNSSTGGTKPIHFSHANTIILDHGNGLFTQYLHLQRDSAAVKEGEIAAAGKVIARSGSTGFASVPHLHFQVQDALGQSLPAKFADIPGGGIPRPDQFYTSGNDGTRTSSYIQESEFPLNAFTGNAITVVRTDLPGHLIQSNRRYELMGKVDRPIEKVAIYVMNSSGGKALMSVVSPTASDGTFTAALDFSELKNRVSNWRDDTCESNLFSLAIAPVQQDGSFWSNCSVPVSIR